MDTHDIELPMNHTSKKPDWQVVTICNGFVVEVDCNSGKYRRVYTNGHIEAME